VLAEQKKIAGNKHVAKPLSVVIYDLCKSPGTDKKGGKRKIKVGLSDLLILLHLTNKQLPQHKRYSKDSNASDSNKEEKSGSYYMAAIRQAHYCKDCKAPCINLHGMSLHYKLTKNNISQWATDWVGTHMSSLPLYS
jgi:hypothetical protein